LFEVIKANNGSEKKSEIVELTEVQRRRERASQVIGFKSQSPSRAPCIRYLCRETTVLSCPRYLINTGVEKMNNI
jgi:hypothetical protein